MTRPPTFELIIIGKKFTATKRSPQIEFVGDCSLRGAAMSTIDIISVFESGDFDLDETTSKDSTYSAACA